MQRRGYTAFWWVRNLIYRMITDRRVISSMFSLSLSSFSHSSIIKKKEKHKRSLVTDNDGRYSTSLSFFTMIIGQLRVNIKLLQSAFFFFCQTDHSLSLFLIFFLFLILRYTTLSWAQGVNIERQCSLTQCQRRGRKKDILRCVLPYTYVHIDYWSRDSPCFFLLLRSLINCMYA